MLVIFGRVKKKKKKKEKEKKYVHIIFHIKKKSLNVSTH